MDKPIYLDNNATTKVAPEVLEAMMPYLKDLYGNSSSMHSFGGQNGKALAQAREQLAALLGVSSEEIVFTSCGTESDSTAIYAALAARPERRHIVTTRVEHPAILEVCQALDKQGYPITWLGVDAQGQIDLAELRQAVTKDTALVSIMYANNEVGTIYPVEEAGAIAREKGALFHTDAVQAVGKIPMNLSKMPIDYLALSGHKLHAPKGVGALYVRRGAPFRPFLRGGHQENGRRAGTENIAFIVALGRAAELAAANMKEEDAHLRRLRDKLQTNLVASITDTLVNGDQKNRLSNTLNISFKYIEGEAILLMMDRFGICASSGSACTSGSLEPSHVLRAMGVPFTFAHGSIRFSLSRYTTDAEIDLVCKELPPIIERLRAISPFTGKADEDAARRSCPQSGGCSCH